MEPIEKINSEIEYLEQVDVIFPVLHGLYGEDGTIQGIFELIKKPYVGCKVLASSLSMDKAYTKIIFEKAGIKQTKHVYIRKYGEKYIYVQDDLSEKIMNLEEVCSVISEKLKYPLFVKPSNSGSSVGIKKAKTEQELKENIKYAEQYDKKIIIEQGVEGRELECAVLGNEEVKASCVGEVLPADEFYSYEAKYENSESKTIIPADLDSEISEKIQKEAIKAFKAVDGKGLSRVDFFLSKDNEIIINEINTLPGFTEISMYSKLWQNEGITYSELLDKLISLALEN